MAILIFLQAAAVVLVTWISWRLMRGIVLKSPFHNLPGPARTSILTGHLKSIYSTAGTPWHHVMSRKYGRAFKVYGFLGNEQIYVFDPRALHQITVKEQHTYEETSMFIEGNLLLFGNGLLSTIGDRHKKQRKLLNPVFSIAHLRGLAPIFYQITYKLLSAIERQLGDGPTELDMLSWMSRAALEYVGQGGLGYSFEDFDNDTSNEYSVATKELFPSLWALALPRQFLPYLVKLGTPRIRRWISGFIPDRRWKKLIQVADIMDRTSRQVFEAKKAAFAQGDEVISRQVGQGKDIMSVLLKANLLADEEDKLPERELLSQMNTLIFAAHDTTSSSLAKLLHILSQRPDIQNKLRQEVVNARGERDGADMSYDELITLPYMDSFVREALRLYPPFTFVVRTTRKEAILPFGSPVVGIDGTPIKSLRIPNGTDIFLGLASANRDPAIWGDDAEEFKPERWMGRQLDEVAKEKLSGVYSGMMTFLSGGRSCIGFNFSQLEMKTALAMLVEKFKFEPSDKEIIWRNTVIQTPTTKGQENGRSQMPLKVSLA